MCMINTTYIYISKKILKDNYNNEKAFNSGRSKIIAAIKMFENRGAF